MSDWKVKISKEAEKDFYSIDGSVRKQVLAGILKVSRAPLPAPNGYGKPLGNKGGNNLTGFFKIKYRDDQYCYDLAAKLYEKYGDKIFDDIFKEFNL